jgi:formate-dependent nitrite reductase membrane component NrfD
MTSVVAPLISLIFLLVTTGLLIADLKRPDRFHYILLKGNRHSWLVWGTWILIAYGAVAAGWLLAGLMGHTGFLRALATPTILLAAGAAGYSALLFGQAEGRDFWQSPLHLPHLLAGALTAGSAVLVVPDALLGGSVGVEALGLTMTAGLLAHAAIVGLELFGSHPSVDVRRAAALITDGPWRSRFWGGVIAVGIALPLALLFWGAAAAATAPLTTTAAALLALLGLWVYEDLWVKAGQTIPLS